MQAGQNDDIDGISEEDEQDESIDIDYGESNTDSSDEEQGENDDSQSERLETTVIKGPDGKSRVIKLRKKKRAANKRPKDLEEDRRSVASRISQF